MINENYTTEYNQPTKPIKTRIFIAENHQVTLAMETKNNEDYTVKDLYPSAPTETEIKAALQVVPQQNWILSQDPEKFYPHVA